MKYVKRVVKPSGEIYLYLRKNGLPTVRLESAEGSPELAAEVDALIRSLSAPKARTGFMRGALREYELGPDFRRLARSTRYEYGLILKEFERDLGELPLTVFSAAFVLGLRNAWAARGHRAANIRLQLLKNVLEGPIIAETIADPFGRISQVRRPADAPEPHPIWSARVLETVMAELIETRRYGLARAVAIARYAGARRDDVVRLRRNVRQGGRLVFLSGKRKIPVDIFEDPELTRWLSVTPDTQPLSHWQSTRTAARRRTLTTPLTIVYNLDGEPYTADGASQELAKVVTALHDRGVLDHDRYGMHGLRHTRGVELALAGATDAEGAAQMGHASPASFAQYRRQAGRIRMADHATEKVLRLRERDGEENRAKTAGDNQSDNKVTTGAALPIARRRKS